MQPILKGEITYVNSTTYLSSEINYSCGTGYKLIGNKIRTCQDDGRWSGHKPKCEGIVIQNFILFIICVIQFKILILIFRDTMYAAGDSEKFIRRIQWK